MHLQGKPIDLEQLKSDTVIAHQMFEKIVQDYLNHGDSVINLTMNIDQKIKDLNKKLNGSHPKRKSFIQQNLPCKKDSIVHGKR